jgi:hypothetical protein
MSSLIMLTFSKCEQFAPDEPSPRLFKKCFILAVKLLINNIPFKLSVCLCPKVITLSGFHCTMKSQYDRHSTKVKRVR